MSRAQRDKPSLITLGEHEVRTLLVSDVHLGYRYSQADHFLDLLNRLRPQQLYLLGDFLDGWKLGRRLRWTPTYTAIFQRLLDLSHDGTKIYYTPGNHDSFLRDRPLQQVVEATGVNLQVADDFVFEGLDGRRYLLTHGDNFDLVENHYQWLSHLVSFVYEPLLSVNWWFSHALSKTETSPYAFCAKVKAGAKSAVRGISRFENDLFEHARNHDCQGVICGHIHSPTVLPYGEMLYLNTGDWVENCTWIIEQLDGSMSLESYFPSVPSRPVPPAAGTTEEDLPTPQPSPDGNADNIGSATPSGTADNDLNVGEPESSHHTPSVSK